MVTNAGPAHLEGFGGIEGVARGKGEMFGGARPRRHRRDQRRRSLCGATGAGLPGARAGWSRSACANAPTSRRATIRSEPRLPTASDHVRTRHAGGQRARSSSRSPASTTCMNALAATAAAMAAGAGLDAVAARAAVDARRVRPAAGQAGAARRAADRRRLQREPGLAARRHSTRWRNAGRALAGARRHGRTRASDGPQLHAEMGALARECGVDAPAAPSAPARVPRSKRSASARTWFANAEDAVADAAAAMLRDGVTI